MRKNTASYHHGDLKTALVQAALQLIREKGPRGFSMNEACRVAGVSVSAPYNHFKNKDALLAEITVEGSTLLLAELLAASSEGSPKEKLLKTHHAYIHFAERHPEYFAVMFQSGIDKGPYPEIREAAQKVSNMAYRIALKMELSPRQAQELVFAIWTIAHGFASLRAEGALARASKVHAIRVSDALVRRLLNLPRAGRGGRLGNRREGGSALPTVIAADLGMA